MGRAYLLRGCACVGLARVGDPMTDSIRNAIALALTVAALVIGAGPLPWGYLAIALALALAAVFLTPFE